MQEELCEFLEEHLKGILRYLGEKSGQFLVISPDEDLLRHAQEVIVEHTSYIPVWVKGREKHSEPHKKIFFIELRNQRAVGYQSLLYYYLELPSTYQCFVCLLSSSSQCLNFFEKRIHSRFRHRIAIIPYFRKPSYSDKTKECVLGVSLRAAQVEDFLERYGLERYRLRYFFELLEPVHIAMLLMMLQKRIKWISLVSEYRRYVIECPELKGVSNIELFHKYSDLLEAALITENGGVMVDTGELREYILRQSPLYLRRLLRRKKI